MRRLFASNMSAFVFALSVLSVPSFILSGCIKAKPANKDTTAMSSTDEPSGDGIDSYQGCVDGQVKGVTSTQITVDFPDVSKYINVYRNGNLIAVVTNHDQLQVNDTGLTPGLSYVYTCQSNTVINGTNITLMGSKTQTLVPQALLSAATIRSAKNGVSPFDSQVQLTWDQSIAKSGSTESVVGYTIFKVIGGKATPLRDVPASSCSASPCSMNLTTIEGISPSTLYTLMVQAYDADGYYEQNSAKLQALTYAGISSATIIDAHNVDITYPEMGNADNLKVYCSLDGGNSYFLQAVVNNTLISQPGNSGLSTKLRLGSGKTSYIGGATNLPLSVGQMYRCKVNASFGSSFDSNDVTLDFMPLGAVNSLNIATQPSASVEAGVSFPFKIQIMDDSSPSNILIAGPDASDIVSLQLYNSDGVVVDSLFASPSQAASGGVSNYTLKVAKSGVYHIKAQIVSSKGQTFTVSSNTFTVTPTAMDKDNSTVTILSSCSPSITAWSASVPSNLNYGSLNECTNALNFLVVQRDKYNNVILGTPTVTTTYNHKYSTQPDTYFMITDGVGGYTVTVTSTLATTSTTGTDALVLTNSNISYTQSPTGPSFSVTPASPVQSVFANADYSQTPSYAYLTAGASQNIGGVAGITVYVEDYFGNTATSYNDTVTIGNFTKVSGASGAILSGASMTASHGVATFHSLQINQVGTFTARASAANLISYLNPPNDSATASITITSGNPVDLSKSKLLVTVNGIGNGPLNIPSATPSASSISTGFAISANGNTSVDISVYLNDQFSQPVAAGHVVAISSSFYPQDSISTLSQITDGSGKVTFTVKSSNVSSGSVVYSFYVDGSSSAIPVTATITAFSKVNAISNFNISTPSHNLVANGSDAATFTAVLKNSSGVAIAGVTPNCDAKGFGGGPDTPLSNGNTCTCGASSSTGSVSCSLKSTFAEYKYPQILPNGVDNLIAETPTILGSGFSASGSGLSSIQFYSGGINLTSAIELLDLPTRNSTSYALSGNIGQTATSIYPGNFDGNPDYSFEIVASNTCSSTATFSLVDDSGGTYSTISVPNTKNGSTTNYVRLRCEFGNICTPTFSSSAYSIAAGNSYINSASFTNTKKLLVYYNIPSGCATQTVELTAARLLVKQTAATKTQIYVPLISGEQGSGYFGYQGSTSYVPYVSGVTSATGPHSLTSTYNFKSSLWKFKKDEFTLSTAGDGADGDGANVSFLLESSMHALSSTYAGRNIISDLYLSSDCNNCDVSSGPVSWNSGVAGGLFAGRIGSTSALFSSNGNEINPVFDGSSDWMAAHICSSVYTSNCVGDNQTFVPGFATTYGTSTNFLINRLGMWIKISNLTRASVHRRLSWACNSASTPCLNDYYQPQYLSPSEYKNQLAGQTVQMTPQYYLETTATYQGTNANYFNLTFEKSGGNYKSNYVDDSNSFSCDWNAGVGSVVHSGLNDLTVATSLANWAYGTGSGALQSPYADSASSTIFDLSTILTTPTTFMVQQTKGSSDYAKYGSTSLVIQAGQQPSSSSPYYK